MTAKPISIAIDGFSSCGKSTLAKALAKRLNYNYLDTGAMYRAVTWHALNQGWLKDGLLFADRLIDSLPGLEIHFELNPETGKSEVFLNGRNVEKEIRGMDVAAKVSEVSAIREVRRKLQALQKQIGAGKRVVMDGRDIGTVVIPDAELKIFLTADPEIRVKRRFQELRSQGREVTEAEVAENLKHRDYIDANREEDPLRKADDARVLDNSELTEAEQLEVAYGWAMETIQGKVNQE
jgi:cytidylate kinase